jgi:HTH-type transcriptional regulator, regulator for ComX
MKDLKKEIGKKIKSTRLDRKYTQADICDDESELTIRQLARIVHLFLSIKMENS